MSEYWPAALFLLQGLMAWIIWSMRRAFVERADLEGLRKEHAASARKVWDHISVQQESLAVLQERVAAIPDHRELAALRDQVGAVQGDIKGLAAGVVSLRESAGAQSATLARIQDYLLRTER